MIAVSQLFKDYSDLSDRTIETKAIINGVTYLDDAIVEIAIENSILSGEDLSFGSVLSAKMTLQLYSAAAVAKNAEIKIEVRMNGTSGFTEWVPYGTYYVDERTEDNGVITFICFDALVKSNQIFVTAATYPRSFALTFADLVAALGIDVETATTSEINASTYEVPYKDTDATINEMLSFMAAAFGGFFVINKLGKLELKKLGAAVSKQITKSDYMAFKKTNSVKTITKTRIIINKNGEFIDVGTGDEEATFTVYNPWAFMSAAMQTAIGGYANGLSYTPMDLDVKGYLYLEPGDKIEIAEPAISTTYIGRQSLILKRGLKASYSMTSVTKKQSESAFKGSISRQLNTLDGKAIKDEITYNGVTISKESGITVERTDGKASILLNALSGIKVRNATEDVFYVDTNGNLVIKGNITMTGGSISWENVSGPTSGSIAYSAITGDKPPIDADNTLSVLGPNRLTKIDANGIYTGTISANSIVGGTITGVTINVTTDATVGSNLSIGSSNQVKIANASGQAQIFANGSMIMQLSSSTVDFQADIDLNAKAIKDALSVQTQALRSGNDNVQVASLNTDVNGYGITMYKHLNLNGYNIGNCMYMNADQLRSKSGFDRADISSGFQIKTSTLSFFNGTLASKRTVNDPSNIVTTQSAGSTYDSTTRSMIDNLKTDVNNIKSKLTELIDALQAYSLV